MIRHTAIVLSAALFIAACGGGGSDAPGTPTSGSPPPPPPASPPPPPPPSAPAAVSVEGCTDPLAANYDAGFTLDDGSCNFDRDIACSAADYTYPIGLTVFDGVSEGVQPGDMIGIEPGVHDRVVFSNVRGDTDNPVTIINCDGVADIGNDTTNNGIVFRDSQHVRLTGTGKADTEYGLRIVATLAGTQGVTVAQFSSDIEIDHLEIQNAGFAGIMAKTDPSCSADTSAERGGPNRVGTRDFTMYNISIHDNYFHDVAGEAIYVGNSFFNGTTAYCGFEQFPHEVRGVEVYGNLVERTGWDGIQVGSAVADMRIYNNVIRDYGVDGRSSQNNGIQVGAGSTGDVFNNVIDTGSGNGIFLLGIGDHVVYNNLIANAGDWAIAASISPTALSSDIVDRGFLGGVFIVNNTVIDPATGGVVEYIVGPIGNALLNNIFVGSGVEWNRFRSGTQWSVTNNIDRELAMNLNFVDEANGDYHLAAGSPAIDLGADVESDYDIAIDADGWPRLDGSAVDAGAFERRD